MLEFDVTVRSERGLHARPAARLVSATTQYDSEILLRYGQRCVDAKSIMGVLILAAPRGATLRVMVNGPDETEARERVEMLFESGAALPG